MPDYRQRLTELSKRTGASVEESDVERLGQTNADDVDRLWGALESQYERRGASDRGVELPDSSEYTAQGYGSGRDDTADDAPQNTRTSSVAPQASGARTSTAGNAYASYLGGGSQAPVSSTMPVQQQPDPMLARLVAQMEADRARQETERAEMRAMVMSQLGQATAPVDANSPGLKPIIDAQKLSLQRGAQRQRSAAAEQAGVRNLGDSGALNTRINQIEQGRGESEAGMIGQILNSELQNKRGQVQGLLSLAVQSGDSEAARTLQGRLAAIDQEMTQNRFGQDIGFRNRALETGDAFNRDDLDFRRESFGQGLDANRYQFDQDLAARLAQMQLQGNLGSMGFLGGLL